MLQPDVYHEFALSDTVGPVIRKWQSMYFYDAFCFQENCQKAFLKSENENYCPDPLTGETKFKILTHAHVLYLSWVDNYMYNTE